MAEIKVHGEADSGIAHAQGPMTGLGPEHDMDVAGATIRKGVFQGVGKEFIQDEAARDGGIDIKGQLVELGVQTDVRGPRRIRLEKIGAEGVDVACEVKARQVAGAV